jgi:hypothetical protein
MSKLESRQQRPGARGHGEHVTRFESFLTAVWDFLVGDDWRTALGVVLALALTSLIATTTVAAWWIMPLAVIWLLALSIRRAARKATHDG